ncbi:hypothetical protein [Rhizobium sp. BK376]|uniref:hypothetical protein n=1 Tax=Rhizobium sp. BK376 TaxID=2512149 RepID=UPI001046D531|nr:hypothetical protein [Rhizobium sp. BK376]TCR92589.1 hypothetical protein EV561_10122 [Rhizobium sp. BK376]
MSALTAADTYCPAVLKQERDGYSVSIQGAFVGKLTAYRSKDKSTWVPIGTYTAPAELDGEFATAYWLKVGFGPGDYTSGTANVNVY